MVNALMQDITESMQKQRCEEAVMVWCGSTERYTPVEGVHESIEAFEQGLDENHPNISPSMMYAYAAIKSGIPFANGAPNLTIDIPALQQLAEQDGVPIAGKDFKTGQTFMKTLVAPGIKAKSLGMKGWFSTNILGNKDGLVLNEPQNFKTKENSKLESLNSILEPELYPDLYGDLYHSVKINYYPPRGDAKEGWDNIDIFGWMGYPMQIKINFLCRDSILAAPIVLDLSLLLWMAKKKQLSGIQRWLSFYFKHPQSIGSEPALHDLHQQHENLLYQIKKWADPQD
jgi:myo-inositol-1-phosphate synthase